MTPAAALASDVVQPVESADQSAKLEAVAASGACAVGRVVLLDFGAVRCRLADRWDGRRANILAKLDGIVERGATRRSIWLRLKDCEYLVCFAEERGAVAQAAAFRLLEEGLTFFLGDFDAQDIRVSAVTAIEGGVVSATPVNPGAPVASFPTVAAAKQIIPLLAQLAEPVLIDEGADRLRLNCGLDEVVNPKLDAAIGCRLAPTVVNEKTRRALTAGERARLSSQALVRIDCRMVEMIPALLEDGSAKLVIVPLSLNTFCISRGRLAVIDKLNRLGGAGGDRLVIELMGLQAGTPVSRLAEAASLVKPFCRSVMAQAKPDRLGMTGVRQSGLAAMSVSAQDLGREGPRLAASLVAFGQAAAQAGAPKLVVTDLPDESFLQVCGASGFTLATIRRADFGFRPDAASTEAPRSL